MNDEKKFCWFKNINCNTYQCCHFCANKSKCESACCDDLKTCIYRATINNEFEALTEERNKKALVNINSVKASKLNQSEVITSKLHKISELAKAINKPYDYIYNKVLSGEIKKITSNNRVYISDEDYTKYIKS